MAQFTSLAGLDVRQLDVPGAPRHSAVVRVTHWLTALSFAALLVSGTAILLVHPRLYWGEAGAFGAPSLVDLPLPYISKGQSGWGRHLHFMAAWVCVLTGVVYAAFGLATQHFRRKLLPSRAELSWRSISHTLAIHLHPKFQLELHTEPYNALQKTTYLAVIFLLLPLIIWTGLAMSPGVTSVLPGIVNLLGGHQSARTVHFFAALLLVLFVLVHIGMVSISGFKRRLVGMITGGHAAPKESL